MLKNLSIAVTILIVSGCGGNGGSDGSSFEKGDKDTAGISINNPKPYKAPKISKEDKEKYLKAINDARSVARDCNGTYFEAAKPLSWSDELYNAAYEHSQDMAKSGVFEHQGSATDSDWTYVEQNLTEGSTVEERFINNNYNYLYGAENIAAGQKNIDEAVEDWLNSEGHCKNIMDPKLKEMGMALYIRDNDPKKYKYYWTNDFGSR